MVKHRINGHKSLMEMLDILGAGGMSGDETDTLEERNGFQAKVLAPIHAPWRSQEITQALHYIDRIGYDRIRSR